MINKILSFNSQIDNFSSVFFFDQLSKKSNSKQKQNSIHKGSSSTTTRFFFRNQNLSMCMCGWVVYNNNKYIVNVAKRLMISQINKRNMYLYIDFSQKKTNKWVCERVNNNNNNNNKGNKKRKFKSIKS